MKGRRDKVEEGRGGNHSRPSGANNGNPSNQNTPHLPCLVLCSDQSGTKQHSDPTEAQQLLLKVLLAINLKSTLAPAGACMRMAHLPLVQMST